MSARRENWPSLLAAFVESRRNSQFAWGINDCCIFAADAVLAMTGTDYAVAWRGKTTAMAAMRFARSMGGVDALPSAAGLELCSVASTRRGDVVAVETEHGAALGICLGPISAFTGAGGLVFQPTLQSVKAWRV